VTNLYDSLITHSDQITDQIAISDHASAVSGDINDRPAKDIGSASQQAIMSAVQLQDVLAYVRQTTQAQISKETYLQTAASD
jgi:hypothetical protein